MIIAALDIETDTSPLTQEEIAAGYTSRGLDPAITQITSIAVTTASGSVVFDGPEDQILKDTSAHLEKVDPAILTTWNGSVFDLPFIQDRAATYCIHTGVALEHNPNIVPKYEPTPGHKGGYDAMWNNAIHLDLAYVFKDEAEEAGVKWSLKPFAISKGLHPIEVDRERMHELTPEELREYVASDADVTYALALIALSLSD